MCFKALEVTQNILIYCDESEFDKVANAITDRERVINIINKLSISLNTDKTG
jgi:flagellin-specific chaperone FliS